MKILKEYGFSTQQRASLVRVKGVFGHFGDEQRWSCIRIVSYNGIGGYRAPTTLLDECWRPLSLQQLGPVSRMVSMVAWLPGSTPKELCCTVTFSIATGPS